VRCQAWPETAPICRPRRDRAGARPCRLALNCWSNYSFKLVGDNFSATSSIKVRSTSVLGA
jgi:hypothetical protein